MWIRRSHFTKIRSVFKKPSIFRDRRTESPGSCTCTAAEGSLSSFSTARPRENPYKDENIGFFHICVAVDDIHEIWDRIVKTGAPQDDPPKQGADFNWQCWTHDPDGIKIELMQLDEKSPQMQFIKKQEKTE
ncbi:MAG: VOC family protein [Lachnospiraceae bacterium]|nr:VOC family protein [Lachnospiraceae bacterium]